MLLGEAAEGAEGVGGLLRGDAVDFALGQGLF